ncbi:MAG: hypothetical protein PHU21_04985 [Elusimicrobia bacterium]|nr:hypothetical protein [Elusimicrobiota bacterium]
MEGAARPDLPGFGFLFKRAGLIYRERWRTIFSIIVVGAAATMAAAVFVPLILLFFLLRHAPGQSWDAFIFCGVCAAFLASAVFVWAQAALGLSLIDPDRGPGAKDCFEAAWAKIPGFAWVCILAAAACTGGFFLLIVPGLVLSVCLAFAPLIYLGEGVGGFAALLKSCHYVKGRFWAVAARLGALCAPTAATSLVPLGRGTARLAVMPLTFIGAALLLAELRRLRGRAPFAPSLRGRLLLALALAGLAVPVFLLPRTLAWAAPRLHALESRLTSGLLDTPAFRRLLAPRRSP